jgi:hypothetical protein
MDIHGDGKKKKGGRNRTVTFASPRDATDANYQQGVKKLEEAFGTRGGYVLGEGALNKNDAMYMMEEDEKRRVMERARKEEEAARFKRMVVKERSLKGVQDEAGVGAGGTEGAVEDGGDDGDGGDGGDGDDGGGGRAPVVGAARRTTGNKKRKTAKELLRVKKCETGAGRVAKAAKAAEVAKAAKVANGTETEDKHTREEGNERGGLTSLLFGEYDDSD